ncbi:MAG: hypothetical protein J1E16_00635 [Muribaculaceae bacterium]|nr:hypothetical protein [Muribaculaceae bacterium]
MKHLMNRSEFIKSVLNENITEDNAHLITNEIETKGSLIERVKKFEEFIGE